MEKAELNRCYSLDLLGEADGLNSENYFNHHIGICRL